MLKKRKELLSGMSAGLITASVMMTVFLIGGFYPFGQSSLAWCDMKQQLIPLFCDFKDILSGKESLFLNFSNGSGMNFYGVFFFFLASPFSFAAAFTDKADIPLLMNILVLLKLSVAGFTAGFTFKKLNGSLNAGIAAALGSAYSLGGYGMLFYQNIMWIDIMYLFPLVVLGVDSLVKKNRPLMLTAVLTLTVIMNFYLSFMVYLFVIIFFGIFAVIYRDYDRKLYVNLGLCGVISLLASAFVWVPCLLQYTASARNGSFISQLKSAGFFAPYETTLTVILCSGIAVAGVIAALLNFKNSQKEDRLWLVSFVMTSIPLIIEPINLMWHMGSYMSFPVRYGFITLFLALNLAARQFCLPTSDEKKKLKRFFTPLLSVVAVMLFVFAVLFALKNSDSLASYVKTLWNNVKAFEGLLFICGIFTLIGLLLFWACKKKIIFSKAVSVLICLAVAVEGFCSAQIFIAPAKDNLSLYNYRSVIALGNDADEERFYRVNTDRKITDANMIGAAGLNSISHYTSLSDRTFMETAKAFGYSGYWMETGNWGGSILSDALLSVGYTAEYENQAFTLNENLYYLGLGLKFDGNALEELPDGDRLTALGEAFAAMSGEENPVLKYDPVYTDDCRIENTKDGYSINNISAVGEICYEITVTEPQTLYFDCYSGFSTRLTEKINDSFCVLVNGETVASRYPTQSFNGLLKLGSFEKETVDITIEVYKTADCTSFGIFGVGETALQNYTKNAACLNLKENGGKIEGEAKSGRYFVSLPYKDNYKITLNGEKLNFSKALSGFIAIDIPSDGYLKIEFTPKGFYAGIAISVLGLALIFLLSFWWKKERSYGELLSGSVYGVFLGGFGAAVLWVYIIPIIVNLADMMI